MEINLFLIFSLVILLFYLWYRYKLYFIINFIIGGLFLIILSNLNFLGFKNKIGSIPIVILTIFYIFLNISVLIISLFNNKKKIYFTFPIIAFIIIVLLVLFLIDPGEFTIFKLGMLIRLFLSFFLLYAITYYVKYLK